VSIGGPSLRAYFAGELAFMRARGFDVVLAAPDGPDLERLCRAEGARARPVAIGRALRPWHDLKSLFRLFRIIAKERPSIVHCHSPTASLRRDARVCVVGFVDQCELVSPPPASTSCRPIARVSATS
jgi:hypothetical protein